MSEYKSYSIDRYTLYTYNFVINSDYLNQLYMHITTTEKEVLIELAHGKNHEQIAESMQKPRRTIEKHIENLAKRYKASFDNPPERASEIMLVLCAIEQDDISNPYQNTEAKLTIFDGELESLRALALYGMLNIASKYTDKSESTIKQ